MTYGVPWLRAATAVTVATAPGRAWAQLAGGGATPEVDYLRVVLALALCLALAVLAVWWLKKHAATRWALAGGGGSGRALRIVETARLHVRATLYVIEFDGRRILVAADANGVVRLADGAAATPTAEPAIK